MTGLAGPAARIRTDLPALLTHVADAFALGDVGQWSVLTTGYEDCNVDLTTAAARVVVKVFAPDRGAGIAARTAGLITAARAVGVRHPRLHRDTHGALVHSYRGHQVLVMDFVPGHTIYDLGRAPSVGELAGIVEQAVAIHTIDAHLEFVFDPWAITNLVPLAGQLRDVLDTEQVRLVGQALEEAAGVDRAVLPVALIHADLTKVNVLIGQDGAVTVLDFAVANRFPRVQELAVVAANLTHGAPEPLPARVEPLPARVETIAAVYSAAAEVPLSTVERVALRAFARAAAAMELLGALAEWHHHGNRGSETEYLIGLGLAGLRDYGFS
ncbi:MAG: Phosphotransferase enzyme family [Pseudonocardiales bacterium]|nr:Phosphotransferase enzyme family [Pseudonocardiales bacterium]